MFDIGFSELLVIAIVALVVLGPERLPKAARFAGLWVRRARNQWDSVKQELERELHAEDIKRQMQDVRRSMQDTENAFRASGEAARRQAQDLDAEGRLLADEVRSTAEAQATQAAASPETGAAPAGHVLPPAADGDDPAGMADAEPPSPAPAKPSADAEHSR